MKHTEDGAKPVTRDGVALHSMAASDQSTKMRAGEADDSGEECHDKRTVDDTALTTGGVKRTRKGERFGDPERINLHDNDFSTQERWAALTAEQRTACDQYTALWHRLLSPSSPAGESVDHVPLALTGLHSSTTLAAAAPHQSAWEVHYQHNKGLFPVKNYIIHAFPMLKTRMLLERQATAVTPPPTAEVQAVTAGSTTTPPAVYLLS